MKRGTQAAGLHEREHETLDALEVPLLQIASGCKDVRTPTASDLSESSRLVVVLHCDRPMVAGWQLGMDGLQEVIVGRGPTDSIERKLGASMLIVDDSRASRQHVAIRRAASGWTLDDLASKNGTIVNGQKVDSTMLTGGEVIEVGETILIFQRDRARGEVVDRELPVPVLASLNTLNAELERRARHVVKIAPSKVPILIRGETGTGKELMARAIHEASGRKGPFVPVNCGALPRELIESELFGHRRGAFSGASEEREGLIRRAHRGTLFLDEIAELPKESQVALLRVLQEGEVRPVGASDMVHVDVRVVAATHQDIPRLVMDRRFRSDLYGRIAGYEVWLPALRHRREDIGMLIAALLPRLCTAPERVTLDKRAARALLAHSWPLNIRELEHALQVALSLADDNHIQLEHLPEGMRRSPSWCDLPLSPKDRALRQQLTELLSAEHGNVAAVARAMDRAPLQIRRWCARLHIDLARFR